MRVGPNLLITNDVHSLLQLSPSKSKHPWGFLCRHPWPKDGLDSSESASTDGQARLTNLPSLFAPGPQGGRQMEERVDRQCARLVDLVEREFISTSVEHRPMKLAVVIHHFATSVLGELLWGQLLHILGQKTVAGTPKGEAMEEFLDQL